MEVNTSDAFLPAAGRQSKSLYNSSILKPHNCLYSLLIWRKEHYRQTVWICLIIEVEEQKAWHLH